MSQQATIEGYRTDDTMFIAMGRPSTGYLYIQLRLIGVSYPT